MKRNEGFPLKINKFAADLFAAKPKLQTFKFKISHDSNVSSSSVGDSLTSVHSNSFNLTNAYNSSLIIQALITVICEMKAKDERGADSQLFKHIYQNLIEIGLVKPLNQSDSELSYLRKQFYIAFKLLLASFKGNGTPPNDAFKLRFYRVPGNAVAIGRFDSNEDPLHFKDLLRASRYEDEFEELEKLGSGGFGVVFKVRNKLDGVEYAVKKIRQRKFEEKDFKCVQQEVKHLAKLRHINIVSYYTSWWENCFTSADPSVKVVDEEESEVPMSQIEESLSVSMNSFSNMTLQPVSKTISCLSSSSTSSVGKNGKFWERGSATDSSESEMNTSIESCSKKKDIYLSPKHQWSINLYIQMELCFTNLEVFLKQRNLRIATSNEELVSDPVSLIDGTESEALIQQILSGVEFIHSKRLIHRDLKPSNIFLDKALKSVKIGDFGLARSLNTSPTCKSTPLTPFSTYAGPEGAMEDGEGRDETGLFTARIGTGTYAAPEQLKSSSYDQKADMYSVGIIYFELYYPMGTGMERAKAIEDLRQMNGRTPQQECIGRLYPQVKEAIVNLLNSDPRQRLGAAEAMQLRPTRTADEAVVELRRELKSKEQLIHKLNDQLNHQQLYVTALQRTIKKYKSRLFTVRTRKRSNSFSKK